MKFRCEHIGVAALNPVVLRDWYIRSLGAWQVAELAKAPPAYMLELPGGMRIEIYQADFAMRLTTSPPPGPNWKRGELNSPNRKNRRVAAAGFCSSTIRMAISSTWWNAPRTSRSPEPAQLRIRRASSRKMPWKFISSAWGLLALANAASLVIRSSFTS
jgi:hypothetical protein